MGDMTISSGLSLPLLLKFAIALIILRLIGTSIYRIWFHPLKDYPGPKLAAMTNLYFGYNYVTGNQIRFEKRLHDQYGDVVRIRPNRLSYTCPEAWKDILGHRTKGRLENSKDTNFYRPEVNGSHNIITVEDPEEHGKLRKIFSNAFSDKALKLQEPVIRQYVDELVSNIKRDVANNSETRLDAVKLYNCTTFDIMGDLTFGEPLGLLQQSQYTPWVKGVFDGLRAGALINAIREYLPFGNLLVALVAGHLKKKQLEHFDHSASRVDKRLAKGSDIGKPDFWKLVLEKGKDKLSLPEMHANASLFMLAGTETTATLLSGLTYLLLINPEKMKNVVEEVRALPSGDLSLEKLPQLPYLNACFEEGLRMYSPIPVGLPRVVPPGGAKIAGRWVAEKTRVSVAQAAACYSERNFTRADSFEPERWLAGHVGYEEDCREVLQPFYTGPRNCLGKNLAYHEMRLILASVLWNFDLELCPETKNWIDQKTYVLFDKPELWIKFKPVQA